MVGRDLSNRPRRASLKDIYAALVTLTIEITILSINALPISLLILAEIYELKWFEYE